MSGAGLARVLRHGPRAWPFASASTPKSILGSALLGDMDWGRTDLLSLSGSNVESLQSAGGVGITWAKASDARRPVYVAASGGTPAYVTTSRAADTGLWTTSGGAPGNADATIWWVGSMNGDTSSDIGAFGGLGQYNGNNSIIGHWTGTWWGGGSGLAAPLVGTFDTALHVFQSVYTGGGYYLLVDGQFVGAFGGNTRNTSAGSGIFAHAGGGFMVNGRIYYGVFASGGIISGTSGLTVSSTLSAQRRAIERYLVRKVPAAVRVPRVLCFGDSQTNGGNLSNKVTDSYPGQLATALGSAATVNRLGNPGNTSTQIAALYGSQLDPNISPIDASTTVVIEVGTNNLLQASGTPSDASTIAASIVADINTIASSARSAGASKIIATNVPACKGISDDSTRETWRQALNTAVRALDNGSTFRCADVAARPELSTFTNHTYFDAADEIHFTATGYGVWKDVIYALL